MSKELVKLNLDGKKISAARDVYIKQKTKQLREFGYSSLTEKEVTEALDKAISGKAEDVISMFIESDLDKS